MKQMHWSTFQTQFPDKAANYPGGEQAYNQQQQIRLDNWANPGGMGGPKQTALGLAGLFGQGGGPKQLWPTISDLQQPQAPQDPWGVRGMGEQITGFGETLGGYGEQLGGFGEQLGGYKDLLSGFGEKFGSFGERLGGFKDEFSGINDKLQGLEQGIASLTDKFGEQQQQQQQRPQQNYMNPFGSFNSYNPYFGGLGAFMRRY